MDVPIYIGGPKHGHDCVYTDGRSYVFIADTIRPTFSATTVEMAPRLRTGTYQKYSIMGPLVLASGNTRDAYVTYVWQGWDN